MSSRKKSTDNVEIIDSKDDHSTTIGIPDDYISVLDIIKVRIWETQLAALRAVNRELVTLYCEIGHLS